MQFTQKIDNYGLLSSCNSTSKEKKKSILEAIYQRQQEEKSSTLPPKQKCILLKLIYIYIPTLKLTPENYLAALGMGRRITRAT